ncbi:MAG TPA: SMI1/KNR4 family protein [Trinickia sp.]|nr:SMI1/KNR4 family protein [Trinickia sp.]
MTVYHGKKIQDLGSFPKWLEAAYDECVLAIPRGLQSEVVSVEDAYLRVTAEDIVAVDDTPRWPFAEFEGYGVRAGDVRPTPAIAPAILDFVPDLPRRYQRIDKPFVDPLPAKHVVDIVAHGALPEGVDAIVSRDEDNAPEAAWFKQVWLWRSPRPGTGVIARASDLVAGQLLMTKGRRVTAERQAVLIAAGVREVRVAKRPRIAVVVSSYERCPLLAPRACWQTTDPCGPYIRVLTQRWGFEVPSIEYLSPPPLAGLTLEERRVEERNYRHRVNELVQRYDLIIGSGLSPNDAYRQLGFNYLRCFDSYGSDHWSQIDQAPGGNFNFAVSPDRSPPWSEVFEQRDEHGWMRSSLSVHHRDQATLVNLPGSPASVAVLMHTLVRRIIDLYEFVDTPGPYWEIGELASDVECDRETNLMLWSKIVWGPRGEPAIDPLPNQEPHHMAALLYAEVIAAIPAGQGYLAAGSHVHFLRLDTLRQPSAPNYVQPEPTRIIKEVQQSTEFAHMQVESTQLPMPVAQSWSHLDEWLQRTPEVVPEGFKPPAHDDDIQVLEGALGVKLPVDFVASLKIHNGQASRHHASWGGECLLDVKGILSEWSCWRDLVASGDFEGMSSDPDSGVKDDWFNTRWIPFTTDGMGNGLCLDLDPAPGGTAGQVIRIWHDDERRERLALSFEQWLDRAVKELMGLERQNE